MYRRKHVQCVSVTNATPVQNAAMRIPASEFLERIGQLLESDVPDTMDEIQRKHVQALTGCVGQCGCSIM